MLLQSPEVHSADLSCVVGRNRDTGRWEVWFRGRRVARRLTRREARSAMRACKRDPRIAGVYEIMES